ncbi:hypothetical protein [Vibrio harveyi]|uniref:hypothetical protein n=1 Tax=Vibrio harveyi TaxID=669 RepID=UPI0009385459|nr:hypothetical protein [Vibrio harveyi]APP09271.1 hypothetical protein BG259_28795 [Vibrio harveyi]
MKKILPLLLLTCASAQAQTHSPELTQLLSEIHEQYNSPTLMSIDKKDMADITKLPYFLQHIDETDTVESIRLQAYLQGLHTAYFKSATNQKRLGGNNWFCMRDTMALDPRRHPEFIVDLIWKVLDKTAKIDPEGFRQANYTAAFSVDIATVINYGLQTEYPCYSPIPKSLQFNGWKY